MNKIALALIFIGLIFLSALHDAKSQSETSAIFINADGSVSGTDKIQRRGNLYTLTDNLYDSPVVVDCNNIILDGAGFALQGAGGWPTPAAINLTCSNVTVQNFNIMNWEVGILGAYNSNTISDNNLTRNERNVAIYADNYKVRGNYIANGIYGIRLQGNNNTIFQNKIANNDIEFWITFSPGTIITANNIEANEEIVVETDNSGAYQVLQNNFVINNAHNPIVLSEYPPGSELEVVTSPWDNGEEGNYWSDYTTKYPNAAEIDNSGIGSIPYTISINPNITDRYPLLKQVNIQNSTPPSQLPEPISTTSPNSTPTPSPSPNPTLSPSLTLQPTSSLSQTQTPEPQPAKGFLGTSLPVEYGYVIVAVVAMAIVVLGILLYFRKNKAKG